MNDLLRSWTVFLMFMIVSMMSAACALGEEGQSESANVKETTAQMEERTDANEKKAAEETSKDDAMRSEEVFDSAKFNELFTVRYFHLQHPSHPGDSILIQTPDGRSMLIDAGAPHVDLQLVRYLQQLGVESIDAVVATHPHSDHIGGFPLVLKAFDIGRFYLLDIYNDRFYYHDMMKAIEREEVEHEYLEGGMSFKLGDEVTVEVLHPAAGVLPEAAEDLEEEWMINHFSLVLKVTYKDTTFLFTGDIFSKQELELVDAYGEELKADFLHVPHHGNASSSSLPFIQTVAPQVAVMGSNIFEIGLVNRYENEGIDVYLTEMHGNILIISDGEQLEVMTEKDWQNPMRRAK